jgi:hypothetical protein
MRLYSLLGLRGDGAKQYRTAKAPLLNTGMAALDCRKNAAHLTLVLAHGPTGTAVFRSEHCAYHLSLCSTGFRTWPMTAKV